MLLKQSNELMYVKGQLKEGEETARRALDLSRKAGDRPRAMRSLHALASCCFYTARFTEALELEQQSLELARQLADRRALTVALNGEASILRALGRFEEAIACFDQSAALARDLKDLPMHWTITRNIGVLYMETGDLEKAEAPLRDALRIANELRGEQWKEQVPDRGKVAREASLETLGNWEAARRHYAAAADYLEQALADKPSVPALTAEIMSNLAFVREKLGEPQKSVDLLEQALKLWETTGGPPHPIILSNQAAGRESLGQLQEALDGQRRALALARRGGGNAQYEWLIRGRLARVERALGRKEVALEEYQAAVNSIEILRASALNTESGRAFALATRREVYEETADLLHDLHREPEALQLAERGRARAFLEILAQSRAGVTDELTPQQRDREQTILARISAAGKDLGRENITVGEKTKREAELRSAEDDLGAFRVEVRRSNPRYASVHYPEPLGIDDIRSGLLDDRTALVEYLLGEKRSLAWVVTKTTLETAVLPARGQIEEQVNEYRKLLAERASRLTLRRSLAEVTRAGVGLYRSVFQPIETAVASSRTLVIVPDGSLNYVPFEALVPGTSRSGSGRPNYVAEKYAVVYGPSASALLTVQALNRGSPERRRSFLAFGDPVTDFPTGPAATGGTNQPNGPESRTREASAAEDYAERGYSLARLPNTRDEILGISRLFPVSQRRLYLGPEAQEEAVKREKLDEYRFVHFATHGFLDAVKPGRSGILFSRKSGSSEDGILQMDEIMRLRMDADLVTLSACSTGLGKLVNGEGILGLTRAFFYAGARSVAVSLWNVNDSATAALMESFYRNLNRGLPRGEAMRRAKLGLIHGSDALWQHPYFWAAFVVQGEDR